MTPLFDYEAYTKEGKKVKGTFEADTARTARIKLKNKKLFVTHIVEKTEAAKKKNKFSFSIFSRVRVRELSLMTRQLASLVKANIPLVEALRALVEQTENEHLKIALEQVRQDVNEGSSFAKALKNHPKIFDTIYTNMIHAGESSGTLPLILLRLADFKETQVRLRQKVVSGMTYPVLMMTVAFFLMIVIFTFVIPKLAKIFESMNKPIPPSTEFLMWISSFLIQNWYLLAAALFGGIAIFKKIIRTDSGKAAWDRFKLKIPILGSLIRMIAITRFSQTMSTLLSSGVSILTGLRIAQNIVGNTLIAKAISQAREHITEGQSIAEPLKKSKQFPPIVIHMISIGEKTGELPDMLENVSKTFEEQIHSRIEALTSLLEPLMIISMGGVVGFIVLSIFIPLLEISNIQ